MRVVILVFFLIIMGACGKKSSAPSTASKDSSDEKIYPIIDSCIKDGDIFPECPTPLQKWTNDAGSVDFTGGSMISEFSFTIVRDSGTCMGTARLYGDTETNQWCRGDLKITDMVGACEDLNKTYKYVNCKGFHICINDDCTKYDL